ncbi:GntR family transcriptional regulator [Terrilactibacillus laevilacticus]|uniref:GntR family transcriptional regulator n=1 Tax=Terrilactibacillus laevilacticus TaxID=1380157 RepID=A0ABW5PPJ8_9BACI|nr:GntR family transcriptional regulator [Terrilactibacillus laevilacticus]
MIDKQSPIPIYYQIEEYIKKMIENKTFNPGEAIPSEREFTEMFEVSRMTIRQALSNLVNQGILVRKKGKGTFISEGKIEQPLKGLTGFSEEMEKRGLVPSSQLLEFKILPVPESMTKRLKMGPNQKVYEIKRIRYADQIPMAIETAYVSCDIIKNLHEEDTLQSFYAYLEKQGLKIGHASQTLEASLVTKEDAKLLDVPEQSPVLLIERLTFLSDHRPLELVESIFRADRYKFVIDIQRQD